MPDIPLPQEVQTTLPKIDKKPIAAAKPPEQAAVQPEQTTRLKSAHGTLEKIANGTPVSEAVSPPEAATPSPESGPSKEVTALLHESNELLLELRDMRLWVNAIATQAADTPLGNEIRTDALRGMLKMETAGLPPEQANQITELQGKIKALNLPEPNPSESAISNLLSQYNEKHPDKPIPAEVMQSVADGKRDASTTVASMLQSNPDLSQMVWKELTGIDGFTMFTPTPERMLELSGLAQTPENMKKAEEIFGATKQIKEPNQLGSQLLMGVMYGTLALQFFGSVALGEQSGGGH